MTAEEIEDRTDEARRVSTDASERVPSENTWGLFVYGDRDPEASAGLGTFLWFEAHDDLLDFAERLLAFAYEGPEEISVELVHPRTADAFRKHRAGRLDVASTLVEANLALRDYVQVAWLGAFGQLARGAGAFERGLRREFRAAAAEGDASEAPVSADEADSFQAFVETYGC